jgi:hypothetical protein
VQAAKPALPKHLVVFYFRISLTLQGEFIYMKMTKLMLCIATLGLAVASAASGYKVSLANKLYVGSTELKPGDYRVEVSGNQATFKMGKDSVQVPATLESNGTKYAETEVDAVQSNLQEIHIGGTTSKIVFKAAPASTKTAQ